MIFKFCRRSCLMTGYLLLLPVLIFAQQASVYPTNWWTGMKWNKVQVMIHADGIGKQALRMKPYAGVRLQKVTKAESDNYVFADIEISAAAKPGTLHFTSGSANDIAFELKQRRAGRGSQFAQGVRSDDFIYLLMPDRFANGDTSNDIIPGYRDTICNRKDPSAHHGGDMQGVIDHLDYLKDMGVSTVWMCPVQENDMPWEGGKWSLSGYHGYWITNHYRIDQRYGGEAAYKKLSGELHRRGMKLIQDAVYNHVGIAHFMYRDMPFKDMFNYWPAYTESHHNEQALFDPYGNAADKKIMIDGWFTPYLPDVNLRNPFMATFFIQNDIWCTEEFGVDGWRVDTYKYCYEPFLNNINNALLAEYPNITVFGEAWCSGVEASAYFTRNTMDIPFKHNLQGVTDFPMQAAMLSAINQPGGGNNGVNTLRSTLAIDMLYQQPNYNCIFLDNHDMDRYLTMIGGDMQKYKMGVALLLTQRGIPQLYYGTEIAMKNDDVAGDGKKRNDFPGGFAGDAHNKFVAANRSAEENEAFNYVKALANFRKTSSAISQGKTLQFIPKDGLYVYFRYDDKQTVMVVVNAAETPASFNTDRYREGLKTFTSAKDITSGQQHVLAGSMDIPAKTAWVLELR